MPRLKQPPTLQTLSLKAVGTCVAVIGRRMIDPICSISCTNSPLGMDLLQRCLDRLNETLFSSVPCYLFDDMVSEIRTSVAALIQETKCKVNHLEMAVFINHMNVVVNLTEVAVHPLLRRIDFSLWPKIMRHVLYKRLDRMTGLQVLNLGSGTGGWKTSDIEKSFTGSINAMRNLTVLCLCFDCTDHILKVVGESCLNLTSLDVTSSRSVTDRSVSSLLHCQKLTKLSVYCTSFSVQGYAQLVVGLPALQDVGRCDELGIVLECLNSMGSKGPFSLQTYESRSVMSKHLSLLVKMCPNVSHVSLYHGEGVQIRVDVLAALDNLAELRFHNCGFFTNYIKELLELKGRNIELLHLEHVEDINLTALRDINEFCPNLKKLEFFNCEFYEHRPASFSTSKIRPFRNLEHIQCVSECTSTHLEFLLSYCVNVKCIHLSSSTGIGDGLLAKVLATNPMSMLEKFKILYSDSLSMKTVDLLMNHCTQLCVLSKLENWEGISAVELEDFRRKLVEENIDLDIRPAFAY